jgi:molybdenum-dependent DNA-binding transcriptional regulator ModE
LREKDRAELGVLRAKIRAARVERRHLLSIARQSCRTTREALRDRQTEDRRAFVTDQRAERVLDREICTMGKGNAKQKGTELETTAKRTLREERAFQRQVRRSGKKIPERTTARERAQEDDDAVRSNLPPELVPVFDKVRKQIKGGPRRSRTEAFLEWAEENPEEILTVQQADADAYLRQLMKEQREMGRNVRNAKRYQQNPEQLAELLKAVPF